MKAEQKELYFYAKDHFADKLNRIKPECVSPIIAVRQTVKTAMEQYIKEYCTNCTKIEDIFSEDDFQTVCNKIHYEIMKGEL